jgi:hypothetical protein
MRLCLWCDRDISDMRVNAKYCCPSHRVMASRARKLASHGVEAPKLNESQETVNEALESVDLGTASAEDIPSGAS